MASHGDRTGRDTLDAVLQRITDLEREVHDLKGGRRVSMDRGDANSLTVDKGAFEGQTLIQYADSSPYVAEGAYYFSNGTWRPFGNGLTLEHAEGRYQIASGGSVTVASGSGAFIDWDYTSGDAVLDLTAPSAPTPARSGWYTVDITYSSTTVTWTTGAMFEGVLQFHGPNLKHARSSVIIGAPNLPTGGSTGGPHQGFVSLSGFLRAGTDTIDFQLINDDSASRDMTVDTAEVSMVYAAD